MDWTGLSRVVKHVILVCETDKLSVACQTAKLGTCFRTVTTCWVSSTNELMQMLVLRTGSGYELSRGEVVMAEGNSVRGFNVELMLHNIWSRLTRCRD